LIQSIVNLDFFFDFTLPICDYPEAPNGPPETVNHNNPPSYRLQEIFEIGQCKTSYDKPIYGKAILKKNDLMIAIQACPELKAFVNTIISLCKGEEIP